MSFESLNLNPALVQALAAAGYNEPTPVQAQSIPVALTGFDLMVSAPTGTGKTAARSSNRLNSPRRRNKRFPALVHRCYVRYASANLAASAGNKSSSAINAQEMPLLQGRPRQSRGGGHRRTGIVANRGGSSFSGKGAEIEGVRDRCILQCTKIAVPLQGARTIPASIGNSEVFSIRPE